MQAHPEREAAAQRVVERIGGRVEVVYDPDPGGRPSAWRTYRLALAGTPGWATHRIIVQDDCWPYEHFRRVATTALRARRDRIVCFFVGSQSSRGYRAMRDAGDAGLEWCELGGVLRWLPTVATAWPVGVIPGVLHWIDGQRWPERFGADDERLGRALRGLKLSACATVPSLVEHPDDTPSIVRNRGGHMPSHLRQSACPPPDDCDLRRIRW